MSYPNLAASSDRIEVVQADLNDELALVRALRGFRPHEVYNLASASFVPMSWEQPVLTAQLAAVGATALLESIREVDPAIRFYQASSSEIFGEPVETPQNEQTPLSPLTPYGVAKAYAHFITRSYRRRYGLYALRRDPLQPRVAAAAARVRPGKVANAAASIKLGLVRRPLARRPRPRSATGDTPATTSARCGSCSSRTSRTTTSSRPGELHSVEELVACAFDHAGLDWRRYVHIDESLKRGKAELHGLVGDPTRARERLGWAPEVSFEELVALLVDAELERLGRERQPEESSR